MNLSFDWSLLGPPLAAGVVVCATHVLFGREVLKRGIIFIDLTVAQVAALGAIAVDAAGFAPRGLTMQLSAGVAALSAAALLSWTEHKFGQVQEALIGSLYVVTACVAILLVSHNPHGGEHLTEMLAGQILWVSYSRVWPVALLYAVLLAAWWGGARNKPALFYPLFAIAVTASVQLVGVYLVFATLILPALAVRDLSHSRGLGVALAIGVAGYAIGLGASVPLDLPSGPLVVCTLAGLMIAAVAVRRGAPWRHVD